MIASHPGAFRVSRRVCVLAGCVLAVALLLALLAVETRLGSTRSSSATGTRPVAVEGRVFINGGQVPARLETRFGRPDGSAQLVVQGFTTAGRRLTRRLTADQSGRFTLQLPPGHYTVFALVFGVSYLTQGLASQPHARVTVARDRRVPPVVRIIANVV